ncbi:TolB family protein [Evansella tamaricis]|uniref:TolB domain-containing protein n=1 Tax=Evansella tamaricis TaxID=2069301 RepID=A0ABS6JAF3_9BACI|nr:TolB domain-containing protein [Evansella tamaricis]MBU9710659.1 TolB domain-containing protein [Evansella tamaricis]
MVTRKTIKHVNRYYNRIIKFIPMTLLIVLLSFFLHHEVIQANHIDLKKNRQNEIPPAVSLISAPSQTPAFTLTPIHRVSHHKNLKAAYNHNDQLWIKTVKGEKMISDTPSNQTPKWSHDGEWLAYSKPLKQSSNQEEILVYHLETDSAYSVFQQGYQFQWAPDRNILAFKKDSVGVLNVIDFRDGKPGPFFNVATGVDNYTWMPDGSGFLVTSNGEKKLDGWTNPVLYKIRLDGETEADVKKGERFFTVPGTLRKGGSEILSIGTGKFRWSPDRSWIAFKVHPTASWAMDNNMLTVLSADGRNFDIVGEMAGGFHFHWAPNRNLLGYIAGEGRLVFGFKNKQFEVEEYHGFRSTPYTPENFVDLSFTWTDDRHVIVSRAEEQDWSNDPAKRVLPELIHIDIDENTQQNLFDLLFDYGDFDPVYLSGAGKVAWVRSNWEKHEVWIGEPDGSSAEKWIESIDQQGDVFWYN